MLPEGEIERLNTFYDERVEEQDAQQPGYLEQWAQLKAKILAFGGQLVCPPLDPEPHVEELIERLVEYDANSAIFMEGAPNRCHSNAAQLWGYRKATHIGTGYALSEDGIWRQHSWALEDGRVIETTAMRDAYVGYALNDGESVQFVASNMDIDDFAEGLDPEMLMRFMAESLRLLSTDEAIKGEAFMRAVEANGNRPPSEADLAQAEADVRAEIGEIRAHLTGQDH